MEQYGNTSTFNIENVLVQNIKSSDYYVRKVLELESVYEVVDEIYNTVDNVEPWLSGNARGASSAFCLLFRLAELKPSPGEIREMLDSKDWVYIRAIGFLYLRYCCNPRDLWKWCSKYVTDTEKIMPSPESGGGKQITVGDFLCDILLDQFYFETIFPRIPKTVSDDMHEELRAMHLPTRPKGNAGQGGPSRRGGEGGVRRPASVKASLSVAFGQRAPNRAGSREYGNHHHRRDAGDGGVRGRGGGHAGAGGQYKRRYSRSRSRSRSRDGYDRGRGKDRSPHHHRDRDRGGEGRRGYDRDRDYDRGRDRDRRAYYDSAARDDRRQRRDRSGSGSREREVGGGGGGGGRSVHDVFRERPPGVF